MTELNPIDEEDRRVVNIHSAEYTTFYSGGVEDGSVLQLNDSNRLGTGFHIYRMAPGDTTVAHEHLSDEGMEVCDADELSRVVEVSSMGFLADIESTEPNPVNSRENDRYQEIKK